MSHTVSTMPANFRSYEGQLRLLTAVIAAHPELRLNYKGKSAISSSRNQRSPTSLPSTVRLVLTRPDIATHYGSDWSASGVEHFFRPIKKNGQAIQGLVKRGEDPATFNHNAVS